MINNRGAPAKVVMRWRRGCSPFQRGRFPGIVTSLRTFEHAPEKVDHKNELGRDGQNRSVGDEPVQWKQMLQVGQLGDVGRVEGAALALLRGGRPVCHMWK